MHPDIAKAIAVLDQRIVALTEIRAKLAAEFSSNGTGHDLKRPSHSLATARTSKNAGSRKETVKVLLNSVGPLSRKEIIARSGLPVGTVATVLNDKTLFHRRSDGTWEVIGKQ